MTIEIRTKALELAVEFSKGFNHSLDSIVNKKNEMNVVNIAKDFERYMKGN